MVEMEHLNNWMSLFLQETFPAKKDLYGGAMTSESTGSISKATGKARAKDV
jgi:hypothetical protein